MFERRNRLVHPKSREAITAEGFVYLEAVDNLGEAERSAQEMREFYDKFLEFDGSIEPALDMLKRGG